MILTALAVLGLMVFCTGLVFYALYQILKSMKH